MSYYHTGNYNASNANGGYPAHGGQGNGIPPATHGHSIQHPQAVHQHAYQSPAVLHQQPLVPPQPVPRQTARAPPPPPIHFVLDRQYTLCDAPLPPAQPAPPTQYAPGSPMRSAPHYMPPRDGPLYAPTPSTGARYCSANGVS